MSARLCDGNITTNVLPQDAQVRQWQVRWCCCCTPSCQRAILGAKLRIASQCAQGPSRGGLKHQCVTPSIAATRAATPRRL